MSIAGQQFVTDTEVDPETGDLLIPIPPEILAHFGWKPGDTIAMADNGDGTFTITAAER